MYARAVASDGYYTERTLVKTPVGPCWGPPALTQIMSSCHGVAPRTAADDGSVAYLDRRYHKNHKHATFTVPAEERRSVHLWGHSTSQLAPAMLL